MTETPVTDRENLATYRYTAKEQREIEDLRLRYGVELAAEAEPSALRELDRRVTGRATQKAVGIGFAGMLTFGLGLSMVLVWAWMLPGILIGCLGIAVMAAMPAVHGSLLRRERKKAAPQLRELLTTETK